MRLGSLSFLAMALVLAGLVAGCDSTPPRPTYADIRFTDGPPIRLDVAESTSKATGSRASSRPMSSIFSRCRRRGRWRIGRATGSRLRAAARARSSSSADASVIEIELKQNSRASPPLHHGAVQRYDLASGNGADHRR